MSRSGHVRLTKRLVEGAQPPARGRRYLFDAEVPGFAAIVRQGATRTFRTYALRFTALGRRRWLTIGEHGGPWKPDPRTGHPRTLTTELAREEALRLRGVWQAGGDPRSLRTEGRAALDAPARPACPTLEDFAKDYMEKHADVHKVARSAREDRGNLERHLLPWRGKARLDDIGPGDVAELQARLKGKPITANRCVALISHMFTMARRWRVLPRSWENPCTDARRFRENRRERFLTAEELARLGPALMAEQREHPYTVAAVLVLAFTGARPTEILTLKREQLHLELGHVMLLRKGKWRPLYLPPPAVAILLALPEKAGNPYVFPGRIVAHHVTMGGLHVLWRRVRTTAKLEDVRPYDLRHTLASMAVNTGYSLEVIGGLLGHTNAATTARYAHLGAGTVRAAGKDIAGQIEGALKGGDGV
jgi:integrase